MLIHDRRVDIGDLGPLGEAVDDKRVQRISVRHADVQEEVAASGDNEDAHDLRQVGSPVPKSLDVLARGRPDGDRDQCLDVPRIILI